MTPSDNRRGPVGPVRRLARQRTKLQHPAVLLTPVLPSADRTSAELTPEPEEATTGIYRGPATRQGGDPCETRAESRVIARGAEHPPRRTLQASDPPAT
jgi:hypothetical protein